MFFRYEQLKEMLGDTWWIGRWSVYQWKVSETLFWNTKLYLKMVWRLEIKDSPPCCKVNKSKYELLENEWNSVLHSKRSEHILWNLISNSCAQFLENEKIGIFIGLLVHLGARICRYTLIVITFGWGVSNGWSLNFREKFNDCKIQNFFDLIPLLEHVQIIPSCKDSRVWLRVDSGVFSCKPYFAFPIVIPLIQSLIITI